jgi:Dyp-type peroxidase family
MKSPDIPGRFTDGPYAGQVFAPTLNIRAMPAGQEPADLDGGSYLAVEVLTIQTPQFDQLTNDQQSAVVGRAKVDGTPISPPDTSSHVQKANPHRNPDDELRRLLRRGYPLIRSGGNGLVRGLIFLAFGRSLTTQHEFIRRGWIDNPDFPAPGSGRDKFLSAFTDPQLQAGGYYFVPPLTKPHDKASWRLPTPPVGA